MKTKVEIKNEYSELKAKIMRHNELYYNEDAPQISDYEYDMLQRQLRDMEKENPELLDESSPSVKIGASAKGRFEKVEHIVKMESLQDAFSKEEVMDFDARLKDQIIAPSYVVETKIDGLSVSLEYINGVFTKGATRGDGIFGENVTANLKTIDLVPKKLKNAPELLVVRGEVYMPHKEFVRVNAEQELMEKPQFKNPRNAAAGSLRQKDANITAQRGLGIFVFNVQQIQGENFIKHSESLEYLSELGFAVSPDYALCDNLSTVFERIEHIKSTRGILPYDIDGAVVKLDDLEQRKIMGSTAKNPRWAIAFKYPPEEKESEITEIEINVGRTGVLTPTAVFKPILLAGTTVSRAVLHNEDIINKLNVNVGDTVKVRKAGDIIPEIVEIVRKGELAGSFKMPENCPSCNAKVVRFENEAAIRCTNPECPSQVLRNIIHFASRTAMDIEGLGPSVVAQLVENEFVKNVADIYYVKREQLLTLGKSVELFADNLLNAIENSKQNNLDKLIFALGIRNIGARAANLLAKRFKTMQNLQNATVQEINDIEGFGGVMSDSALDFFAKDGTKDLLLRLENAGVNMQFSGESISEKLLGLTIVITGTLPTLSRVQAQELVEKNGGKTANSVSKKTSYVLAGEAAGSKLTKAQNLGINILSEQEFFELIENENM